MIERQSPVVFFDIGQTLGAARFGGSPPRLVGLDVFPDTVPTLKKLLASDAQPILGIISNTGKEDAERVNAVLEDSGLLHFFHPELLIYSKEVGLIKDSPLIFELAAGRAGRIAGALPGRCVFVGEDPEERNFAKAAGMRVAAHPSLAQQELDEAA